MRLPPVTVIDGEVRPRTALINWRNKSNNSTKRLLNRRASRLSFLNGKIKNIATYSDCESMSAGGAESIRLAEKKQRRRVLSLRRPDRASRLSRWNQKVQNGIDSTLAP